MNSCEFRQFDFQNNWGLLRVKKLIASTGLNLIQCSKYFYHNMKGKREDNNNRPKSISENLYTKQFANPPSHVEYEQRTNCTRPQSMSTKETEPYISARPAGVGKP